MIEQTETIAGHCFTLSRDTICECGMSWPWLKAYGTRDKIGQQGIAHHGQYTEPEYGQRERRKAREDAEDERCHAAIAEVAKA